LTGEDPALIDVIEGIDGKGGGKLEIDVLPPVDDERRGSLPARSAAKDGQR